MSKQTELAQLADVVSVDAGSVNINNNVIIDSAGRVTMPYQPAFHARWSTNNFVYGSGDTIWNTTNLNIGNCYNTSTGRFTAPISGTYMLILNSQHYGGTSTGGWQDIYVNSGFTGARAEVYPGASYDTVSVSLLVYMNAGDYANCYGGSGNIWWSHHSFFEGYLIG